MDEIASWQTELARLRTEAIAIRSAIEKVRSRSVAPPFLPHVHLPARPHARTQSFIHSLITIRFNFFSTFLSHSLGMNATLRNAFFFLFAGRSTSPGRSDPDSVSVYSLDKENSVQSVPTNDVHKTISPMRV